MKKYEFLYNGSKDKLLGCFPDKDTYIDDDHYIIKQVNGIIFIGLRRTGYSNGEWYVGNIIENDGNTIISGNIVVDPDGNGKARKKNRTEDFGFILLSIIFFPITILYFVLLFCRFLYTKIAKKKYETMNNVERLKYVMESYFNCHRL